MFWQYQRYNDFLCASNFMVWELFECYSNYAVVAMMAERCIVVFFPLQAKIFLTRRFTIALLCLCILPCCVALIPVSAFVLGIQHDSSWSANGVFCGFYSDRPAFPYFLWAYQLIMFTFHVIIAGILVVVLFTAIAYSHSHRRHLIQKNKDGGNVVKEHSAIVVILLVSCINIVVFIPGLVSMIMNYLVDTSTWSQSAKDSLANFGRFAEGIPCVTHSVNFLVYISRIPTFRAAIGDIFSCCLAK